MTARLCLGGPLDGQIVETPRDVLVAVELLDAAAFMTWGGRPLHDSPRTRRVFYETTRVALFDRIVPVLADERLSLAERNERARAHLLSDTARALLS